MYFVPRSTIEGMDLTGYGFATIATKTLGEAIGGSLAGMGKLKPRATTNAGNGNPIELDLLFIQ